MIYKLFGKSFFFEKYAPKSDVFIALVGFLKSIPESKRELFFRRLFAQYISLQKISLPCLMWLEAFNLDIEKPTYDANVMKVLLMFYEEQLLMVKFNGSGGDGFKVIKKFSNLSDVDITWFAKEKGE